MRPSRLALAAPLLLALLAPGAAAQAELRSVLTIDVQEDLSERMTLRFEGLRRNTEYRDLCLPQDALPTRVHDASGPISHTQEEKDGRATVTFRARGESAAIEMTRPAPEGEYAPFFAADANFCVPEGSRTSVRVEVPAGHEVFFIGRGGVVAADGRSATLTRDGPLHVFYTYEAPLDPSLGLAVVEESPFRLVAPAPLAEQARVAAQAAGPALRAAIREAGLEMRWDALRVRYVADTEFTWEAGHYGGRGLVTVRQSTLAPDPREGYPLVPARVLVHEAFHALSTPHGRGAVTDTVDWWLEGAARHAERHVLDVLPNATRHCERTAREARCWDFDDRISRADLEQAYDPSFEFERRWTPSLEQSEETRSFYYRYTAFLVGAFVQTHGEAAYREAWDRVSAAFERDEGCPCGPGWLERVLTDVAGVGVEEIHRPYGALHDSDPTSFQALVRPFVKDEAALKRDLERLAGRDGLFAPAPGALALAAILGGLALAARGLRRRGR